MRKIGFYAAVAASAFMMACGTGENKSAFVAETISGDEANFEYMAEQFADLKIIRYRIPQWDKLSLQQKQLVYYLSEAGYAGRDIMWDQNYRHNLAIRKALENVYTSFEGDKTTEDWANFETYLKRVWFSNGIHHHYSNDKLPADFSPEYLKSLLADTKTTLADDAFEAIFDTVNDIKKVNLNPNDDIVLKSAVNMYGPAVTEADVDNFYGAMMDKNDTTPISYGLNSRLVKNNGTLEEEVYHIGGKYSAQLEKVVANLEKAVEFAENPAQADALRLLIDYYRTGDLKTWDAYNIAWVAATEGDIDYINGFIEVYNDPKGYRGSYETVVQIKDFDMSAKMSVLAENAQWFEDNSPLIEAHKKENVKGVSYKVVNVAAEAGDASPSTPIGVNLPNADWIRATHGSKSVSLGNIVFAYGEAGGKGITEEFAVTPEVAARIKEHGTLASKLHTALHEVVGHASGQLEKGVGTPKQTLKSYASTLEEGRADLLGLYYLMDSMLIKLGLMPSLEVGIAAYDNYLMNGLMTQLRRLEVGADVEEAHMRNRQWITKWVLEKGAADKVCEVIKKDGKTYVQINDYAKLRVLFGELLSEVQRIKSQGDYEAGKALVENYGVKVDQALHQEILDRSAKFESAPYGGFMNPRLSPVTNEAGEVTDVKVEYIKSFTEQMLEYASKYSNN